MSSLPSLASNSIRGVLGASAFVVAPMVTLALWPATTVAPPSLPAPSALQPMAAQTPLPIPAPPVESGVPGDVALETSSLTRSPCILPNLAPGHKLVVVGQYESARLPTAAPSDDVVTDFADIVIEAGQEPLYVVLAAYNATIWRFSGETSRVAQVVATALTGDPGIIGIARERVDFQKNGCIKYFTDQPSVEKAVTLGAISRTVGRRPDAIVGSYVIDSVTLPSMELKNVNRGNPMMGTSAIVQVDPVQIVSPSPFRPYTVLPGRTGLTQLTGAGYLVELGSDQYRIVKSLPAFPAGLSGSGRVRFLLSPGVKVPKSGAGHSCVVDEATGSPVVGTTCMPGDL